ncbi:MAG: translocation protein TolB, partial [Parachlamydiaceae bacterium]
MFKRLLALLVVAVSCLAEEAEIVVTLETESSLLPLYLGPINDGDFEPSYGDKIRKVFAFDMNYNGMTSVMEREASKDKRLRELGFDERGDLNELKNWNAYFILKGKIVGKKLNIRLIVLNNGAVKAIDGIDLTGNIQSDRRQVHLVADRIFKELFGEEGIASTKILFTIKSKNAQGHSVSEVYESDYDGHNLRAVTKDAGYVVTPAYVPPKPGHKAGSFFYVSYKNGQPKIFFSSLSEFKPIRFSL